ncbi:MAG TPA: hypothetical protein VF142_13060 [Longimicrobium sp.]
MAALDYLVERAEARVLVDPRPLRRGADLAHVGDEDLAAGAEATTRQRAAVLAEREILVTDAVGDFRCTFRMGVRVPPEREQTLPDSIRQRSSACRAREPYTAIIVGLPAPAQGDHPAGTWHVEAVAMTLSGFQIWDLYLRSSADGTMRVADGHTRLNIRS